MAAPVLVHGDGSHADNARLLPDLYPDAFDPLPADTQLREPYDLAFDVNWAVSLRGAYQRDRLGDHFEVLLVPGVGLRRQSARSALDIDASADILQPINGPASVSGLRLGLGTRYDLDGATQLTGNANLTLTTPTPGTPGQASTIASGLQRVSGGVDLGITRQLGRFSVGLTGALNRTVYGQTRWVDSSVVENGDRNVWALDSGLRIGFQATPIFEVFGKAGLGRDMFDQPSTTLLVRTDATAARLEAGVKGQWNNILEAEISAGIGWRRFDAASLSEVRTNLYDASVSFTPDPTWKMTAGFSTTVEPSGPNGSGTARIGYSAQGTIDYTINSWLALNGLANWRTASFAGSTDTESGYGYGLGANYKVSGHTAVSADYAYDHADTTGTGPEDSHRVTMGITLSN